MRPVCLLLRNQVNKMTNTIVRRSGAVEGGVLPVLRSRRSIRRYTDRAVSEEHQELLVEALLRSPTSRNGKSWEFVLVDDRALLERLALAKSQGGGFLRDAALAIVLAGDSSKSDVWIEDAAIAGIVVQVAAHSLGLGTCWVQIRNRAHDENTSAEAYVQRLLELPEHMKVAAVISIGHPAESKPTIPAGDLDFGKVRHNRYSEIRQGRRHAPQASGRS